MPRRAHTRKRGDRRKGTRKMVGGAVGSPVEILAGMLSGLASVANDPAYSEDSKQRIKAILGFLVLTIFSEDDEGMVGGGGPDGPNRPALTDKDGAGGAGTEEEDPATTLVREREQGALRRTARGELYRAGFANMCLSLLSAAAAVVAAIIPPLGGAAPAPAVNNVMGSSLVVSNGAVGFPGAAEAAAGAAAPAPGMGGGRMAVITVASLTALATGATAVSFLRRAADASERETRVAAPGGSTANAVVEAARATAAGNVGVARQLRYAEQTGQLAGFLGGVVSEGADIARTGLRGLTNVTGRGVDALGGTARAALGAGGVAPALLNAVRAPVVAGIEGIAQVRSAGVAANANVRRARIEAGASVRRAEIQGAAAVNAATAGAPIYNTMVLVGDQFASRVAGMGRPGGATGGAHDAITGAAAAAAGGGGARRRRAGSNNGASAMPAPVTRPLLKNRND